MSICGTPPFLLLRWCGGMPRAAGSCLRERIDEPNTIVNLARTQIFRIEFPASETESSGHNGGIPIGNLMGLLELESSPHEGSRNIHDGKSLPEPQERDSVLMGKRLGARGSSGLDIELLQNLHGKNEVAPAENLTGFLCLNALCRSRRDSIKENVGVQKNHARLRSYSDSREKFSEVVNWG